MLRFARQQGLRQRQIERPCRLAVDHQVAVNALVFSPATCSFGDVGATCSAADDGFRSTFRDWAAERTAYPHDLAEMALAHALESKVEAAHFRGDMLAKRITMMQDWADYCLPTPPRNP